MVASVAVTAAPQDNADATLAALYRGSWTPLVRRVTACCGSRELAEDLVASAFAAAASRLRSTPDTPISQGWLMTVARRRLVDHYRRAARLDERLRMLATQIERDGDVESHDPIDALQVREALAELAPRRRTAALLRYCEEQTVGMIAIELGISTKAAESLLARTRHELTDTLGAMRAAD